VPTEGLHPAAQHGAAPEAPVHPRPAHRATGPHSAQGPHRQAQEEQEKYVLCTVVMLQLVIDKLITHLSDHLK